MKKSKSTSPPSGSLVLTFVVSLLHIFVQISILLFHNMISISTRVLLCTIIFMYSCLNLFKMGMAVYVDHKGIIG